jgi:hypothetical protein
MAAINLDEIANRPQRYWDVDGFPELVMGLLWMLWGAAWLVGESVPRGWQGSIYWMLVPALLVLSGVAAVRAIKLLKARYTFPRTGYVEWNEPSRTSRVTAAAVAMVTAMVVVVLVIRADARSAQNAPMVLSVILSLAFVVASIRQRAPHLLALAGVAIALGLAFGAIDRGWQSVNWMFVALGAASAALGAVRLALFVRRHPLPSEGA